MTVDLVDYSGNFDLILVAKFNEIPSSNNAAFFATGVTGTGFLIGVGSNNVSNCKSGKLKKKHFLIRTRSTQFYIHDSLFV